MTIPIPATLFADPAPAERLERAAAALTAHGFSAEIPLLNIDAGLIDGLACRAA